MRVNIHVLDFVDVASPQRREWWPGVIRWVWGVEVSRGCR
jgi:hypothetical protein